MAAIDGTNGILKVREKAVVVDNVGVDISG